MIDASLNGTVDVLLRSNAAKHPEKAALNFLGTEHKKYSFPALVEKIDVTAAVLQHQLNLVRGDRVAFYGKNSDDELILLFAAAALGLIFVPLNWRLAPRELNYIVRNADISALFFDEHFAEHVDALLENQENAHRVRTSSVIAPETKTLGELRQRQSSPATYGEATLNDPLLIVYTSGTTGRPKGAVHTQHSVLSNAFASVDAFDLNSEDHILTFLPLFHVGGINIQTLPTLFVGGTVTLAEQFSPDIFLHGVQNAKISSVTVVPTILRALISLDDWPELDISSLKCMAIGSTDVPTELIEAVHKKQVPVVQIYGATETGPVSIYQKSAEAFESVGSIGKCGLNSKIRLVDEGADVPVGEPGEIWVSAPNCFSEYWNNDVETEKAFSDGWFKTGDIASMDENGFFWFCARSKNIIISGGENIYPAEIERILLQQEGVHEVAVVGKSDPKWGEVPVAVIKGHDGLNSEQILKSLNGRIAKFKCPKSILFVDEIPKNALGKVMHTQLKEVIQSATLTWTG